MFHFDQIGLDDERFARLVESAGTASEEDAVHFVAELLASIEVCIGRQVTKDEHGALLRFVKLCGIALSVRPCIEFASDGDGCCLDAPHAPPCLSISMAIDRDVSPGHSYQITARRRAYRPEQRPANACTDRMCFVHDGETCARGNMRPEDCPAMAQK